MDERLEQIEAIVPQLAVRVPNPFDSDRPLSLPGTETVDDIVNGMMQASGRDELRTESAAGSFLNKETYHALSFATTSNVQCIRHLLTVKKFRFVLTRKMSSDPIESMFGFLRRSSGSNDILDAKSAICGLEKMLKTGIVAASDQSNVQSSTSFAARQLLPIQHSPTMPATGNKFIDQAVNDFKNHCTTLTPRITGPDEASVAMVGGFIVRAATESIVCSNCIALLQGQKCNTPLLGLIAHQDRGGLFYPSQELVKLLIGLRKLVDHVLPHRKYFTKPLEVCVERSVAALMELNVLSCSNTGSDHRKVLQLMTKNFIKPLFTNYAVSASDRNAVVKFLDHKPLSRKVLKL
ncbi:hypothetical protein HPB49_000840 [Dermacentor silvarum]|uniref:Uncharacterized protein n=1 Tax=Dermacentor silvarum TaxID=543639 RepID=A0ACB8CNU6_DERSI|nr:hypothetical protein HPB49_000840 [Dermacentor silvarum]